MLNHLFTLTVENEVIKALTKRLQIQHLKLVLAHNNTALSCDLWTANIAGIQYLINLGMEISIRHIWNHWISIFNSRYLTLVTPVGSRLNKVRFHWAQCPLSFVHLQTQNTNLFVNTGRFKISQVNKTETKPYKALLLSPKEAAYLFDRISVKHCTEQAVNEDNLPGERPVCFRRTMERRMLTIWYKKLLEDKQNT